MPRVYIFDFDKTLAISGKKHSTLVSNLRPDGSSNSKNIHIKKPYKKLRQCEFYNSIGGVSALYPDEFAKIFKQIIENGDEFAIATTSTITQDHVVEFFKEAYHIDLSNIDDIDVKKPPTKFEFYNRNSPNPFNTVEIDALQKNKSYAIRKIIAGIRFRTSSIIDKKDIILIDDDYDNIKDAYENGYKVIQADVMQGQQLYFTGTIETISENHEPTYVEELSRYFGDIETVDMPNADYEHFPAPNDKELNEQNEPKKSPDTTLQANNGQKKATSFFKQPSRIQPYAFTLPLKTQNPTSSIRGIDTSKQPTSIYRKMKALKRKKEKDFRYTHISSLDYPNAISDNEQDSEEYFTSSTSGIPQKGYPFTIINTPTQSTQSTDTISQKTNDAEKNIALRVDTTVTANTIAIKDIISVKSINSFESTAVSLQPTPDEENQHQSEQIELPVELQLGKTTEELEALRKVYQKTLQQYDETLNALMGLKEKYKQVKLNKNKLSQKHREDKDTITQLQSYINQQNRSLNDSKKKIHSLQRKKNIDIFQIEKQKIKIDVLRNEVRQNEDESRDLRKVNKERANENITKQEKNLKQYKSSINKCYATIGVMLLIEAVGIPAAIFTANNDMLKWILTSSIAATTFPILILAVLVILYFKQQEKEANKMINQDTVSLEKADEISRSNNRV